MIAGLAFLRRMPAMLTARGWLIVAILAAFAATGAYCAHRGAEAEKTRQAAQASEIERKASTARETAADERLTDTTTIRNRQEERDHEAQALPDGVPDERELRRRCRQLREAGRSVSACERFAG